MSPFSNSPDSNKRTISRPTLSAVVDPLRELFKLPPRPPVGFTPSKTDTFVETIIDTDGTGIGPLSVSTSCTHLFCYSVRYEHRNIGIMLIAGNCINAALAKGSVQEAISSLHHQTLVYGPIIFHSLTTVETPKSASGLLSSWVLHQGQTLLHEAIVRSEDTSIGAPPPLALIRLKLRGWLPNENSVPTCIFDGGTGPLMLHVAWGKATSDVEHIRLA